MFWLQRRHTQNGIMVRYSAEADENQGNILTVNDTRNNTKSFLMSLRDSVKGSLKNLITNFHDFPR